MIAASLMHVVMSNGRWRMEGGGRPPGSKLLRLDASVLDDLPPFGDFLADEPAELPGAPANYLGAALRDLLADVGRVESARELLVQFFDDRLRCAGGNEEAVPYRGLDAGQPGLRQGRNVRQDRDAGRPGDGQRTQLARLHQRGDDERVQVGGRNLATEEIRQFGADRFVRHFEHAGAA